MQAIILAGGFGTRLQSVAANVPKPMAPVAGRPFLEYLLAYLIACGATRIVLSTGYKSHCIEEYFGPSFRRFQWAFLSRHPARHNLAPDYRYP